MEELLQRAVGHGIVFSGEFPDDLPPVLVDANQLELALLNVALNARDAMADGGSVKITACAERVPDSAKARHSGNGQAKPHNPGAETPSLRPAEYIRIMNVDTRVGMDQGTLAKATAPFSRTNGPGKRRCLALSLVLSMASQSGSLML